MPGQSERSSGWLKRNNIRTRAYHKGRSVSLGYWDGWFHHHAGFKCHTSGSLCRCPINVQNYRWPVSGLCPLGASYEIRVAALTEQNGDTHRSGDHTAWLCTSGPRPDTNKG